MKNINLVLIIAIPIFISEPVFANEPDASLQSYGKRVEASSKKGIMKMDTVFKTTDTPMLAYRIDFKTSDKALLARQDAEKNRESYLLNVGVRELWKSKFCTAELRAIMYRYNVNLVSGMLKNKAGEMQFLATCFKE